MSFTRRTLVLGASLGLLAGSCDDTEATRSGSGDFEQVKGSTSLIGRIDSDGGYQQVSPLLGGLGFGEPIFQPETVRAVVRDGSETVVVTAPIGEDGMFALDGVPRWTEPFVIEALDREQEVVGAVVVPGPAAPFEALSALPISAETTLEARVFSALTARRADVSPIDVANAITAQMANPRWDGAWVDATDASIAAWQAALAMVGGPGANLDAARELRGLAFAQLADGLTLASSPAAEQVQWEEWLDRQMAAIEATTGIDPASQATATAAGAFALVAEARRAAVPDEAVAHAYAAALERVAQAQLRARTQGSVTSPAEQRVAAAYDTLLATIQIATTAEALDAAQRELGTTLSAALDEALAGDHGVEHEALATTVTAATAALDASLEAAQTPQAVAAAFVSFAKTVRNHAGALAPQDGPLAASLAQQAALFSVLPLSTDPAASPDGAVTGVLLPGIVPTGAQALVADMDPALDTAAAAWIGAVRDEGDIALLGVGTADPARATWSVVADPSADAGMAVLQLLSPTGATVGAAFVPGGVTGGTFVAPAVTEGSTARTLVALDAASSGVALSEQDQGLLNALIPDGTATALLAENHIGAAADALIFAQRSVAASEPLGTDPALARLAAYAAFELHTGVTAQGPTLATIVDAELQLNAAMDAVAVLRPLVVSDAVLDEALEALRTATAEATSREQIARAGADFEQDLRHVVVAEWIAGTDLAHVPAVAAALRAAADARETLLVDLRATMQGAASPEDAALGVGAAFAAYEADLDAAFAEAVAAEPHLAAIEEAATLLGAGLYGARL